MHIKIRFSCFVILFTLLHNWSIGQVLNVDRELATDTVFKRIRTSTTFNFSADKQRNSLIDLNTSAEVDYFLKNNYLFVFLGRNDLALNGNATNENNGFFQLRFRDNDTRKVAPDFFTQYQWNGIQGMEYRGLGGVNLRFKWLEKSKSDLYTGIGIFYEKEKWNPGLPGFTFLVNNKDIIYREFLRLNMSAKFAIKLTEHIDFSGISFIQFPIQENFLSPRWYFDSNLNIAVTSHINIVLHYEHTWDGFRPLPIDEYYYSFQTGINFLF